MVRKYRSHTADFKFKVALEAVKKEKTINQIASEYAVSAAQVVEWKKLILDNGASLFQGKKAAKAVVAHEDVDLLQKQIGKLTVQNDWLKKKLEVSL